jgi:hypothetical protein
LLRNDAAVEAKPGEQIFVPRVLVSAARLSARRGSALARASARRRRVRHGRAGTGDDWKADVGDDPRDDDPPKVVILCPVCWEREFGESD